MTNRRSLYLAITIFGLTGCGGEPAVETQTELSAEEKMGGFAVICSQAALEGLNPFVSPDMGAADVRMLLFSPLALYDDAGGFRPYLATSWEWSDDRRELVLTIRRDLTWHDGAPVTADDVAWTLEAAANIEYAYWSAPDFSTVEDVTVRDSATVAVRFSEPYVLGLEPFVALPILPRHLLGELAPDAFTQAEYHNAPVGSGPFRLVARRPDGSIVFDRHPEFPVDLGHVYLDRIIFLSIIEPTTLYAELQAGRVDVCTTGQSLAERVEASPRLELHVAEPTGVQVLPLNVRHPPLDDARVRRAISAAIRRAEIAAIVSPLARPARTFMPPGHAFIDSAQGQPDSDPELAAALLDSAGWRLSNGGGIRRDAAGQPLRFTLLAPPALERTLTVVQAQLRAVGVDMQIRTMEDATFISTILDPETRPDAMALAFFPEKVLTPDVFDQLHSTGGANLSSYADPAVDSLAERLEIEVDAEAREAIYRELQRLISEDVPVVYTVYLPRPVAANPRVKGVEVDVNGPFASVAEWWITPGDRR